MPRLIALPFLRFVDCVFLQTEGKTTHQQKDYNSLNAQLMVG